MRVAPAVLALLVVLAGCPAFDVDRDPGPATPTAAPGPATATPRPIGLTASGVTDPFQLREAHTRVLDGQSYTYDYRLTVSWGGTARGRVDVVAGVTADRSRSYLEREVVGDVPAWLMPVGSTRQYDAGTTTYVRNPETGETTVEQSSPGATIPGRYTLDSDAIYLLLSEVDTAVTGTEIVDGRTLYVVEGTADATESSGGAARNVSVRAAVASSGLVVEFRLEADVRREDPVAGGRSRVHVVHEIAYRAVGETTVERPAWAGEAGTATSGNRTRGGGHVDDGLPGPGIGQPPIVPSAPGPE